MRGFALDFYRVDLTLEVSQSITPEVSGQYELDIYRLNKLCFP